MTLVGDDRDEILEELEEIAKDIRDAIERAKETMRRAGGMAQKRANAYWIAQIEGALEGGSMHSLQDTIDEITGNESE